jgi:hypothetical protein
VVAASLLLAACHSLEFEVAGAPRGDVVTERNDFFVFGMFPQREIHGRSLCPRGVAAIHEETTALDGVYTALTLGLWSPRTSTITCRAEVAQ